MSHTQCCEENQSKPRLLTEKRVKEELSEEVTLKQSGVKSKSCHKPRDN